MKKLTHEGFGVVGVIIIILALAAVAGLGYVFVGRSGDETNKISEEPSSTGAQNNEQGEAPLVLQNLGLKDISKDIQVTADALREYDAKGMKGFYAFGEPLPSDGSGRTRINPNFEFASVRPDAEIVSAIDGIVVNIKDQGQGDYEVFVIPSENSTWTVGYDHVRDVKVQRGDKVSAGDVLGYPVVQGNGLYRFELQVNGGREDDEQMYCPVGLLDDAVREAQSDALGAMLESWNELRPGLYDLTSMESPGCVKTALTVAESEGR